MHAKELAPSHHPLRNRLGAPPVTRILSELRALHLDAGELHWKVARTQCSALGAKTQRMTLADLKALKDNTKHAIKLYNLYESIVY